LGSPACAHSGPGAAAGEDGAEDVGEARATEPAVTGPGTLDRPAETAAEQTGRVELATARTGTPADRTRAEQGAHLVVLFALLVVGQHVVRLGRGLEPLLRVPVSRAPVGVQLARQL